MIKNKNKNKKFDYKDCTQREIDFFIDVRLLLLKLRHNNRLRAESNKYKPGKNNDKQST